MKERDRTSAADSGVVRAMPEGPRTRLGGALSNLCLLALAGALLGMAGPWLARLWLGFDVFSHFLPHFAFLAVAAFACLLFPSPRGLAFAFAFLLAGALAISAISWVHASPGFFSPSAPGRIRLMSYNSWRSNLDLAAMEREIRRHQPDMVGLIEFSARKLSLENRLRNLFPYRADCHAKPRCSLALLSRWPILKVKAASLWEGPPYLHAWVKTPQGVTHVFVVHTLRFPWMGSQFRQIKAMARIVHHTKGPRIVMGDFNASPFSLMLHTFVRTTGLERLTWLPTWPARPFPFPQIAIDHVFTSRHFQLAAGPWVGFAAGSDHLPVILELRRL